MKIVGLNSKFLIKSIFTLSLGIAISACNSGGSSTDSSTTDTTTARLTTLQNQLTLLQNQVIPLQNKIESLQGSITTLQADDAALQKQLIIDETKLSKITLLGHQPNAASSIVRRTEVFGHKASITQSISYGPCSDMGVLVGSSQPDPLTAVVENFKQCTGYEYGAIVETGEIVKPFALWFDGANCTGNMFEAENDGSYNRQTLQNGVVFLSPVDGITELMVTAGQIGQITILLSNFSGGTCNSGITETQTAYHVSTNDLSITGVPSVVPANFIL